MNTELRDRMVIEFSKLINKNSLENDSNSPDFILANYLVDCLEAFNSGIRHRDNWYGGKQSILDMEKLQRWE